MLILNKNIILLFIYKEKWEKHDNIEKVENLENKREKLGNKSYGK